MVSIIILIFTSNNIKLYSMKVYRYEILTEEGFQGPYTAYHNLADDDDYFYDLSRALSREHSNLEHPSISFDCESFERDIFICGCKSIKALKEWFDGFNDDILGCGFMLVEYTTNNVLKGKSGRQVAIDISKSVTRKIIK